MKDDVGVGGRFWRVTNGHVFHADGRQNWKVLLLHVDHIKPRSLGGTNDPDNLQTLCRKCNIGKSNKDDTDLRA
jgi:5-methylcytosine-specific restriction endonuclease McrA